MSENKRNYNIDLLKILSSVAVVGLHSFGFAINHWFLFFYYASSFAIPVFLICSGYVLLGGEKRITRLYCIKKVVGIIKMTFVWSIIFSFLSFFNLIISGEFSFSVFVKKFAYDFGGGFIQKGSFWHFWYLGVMIILYVCLPVFYFLKTKFLRVFKLFWCVVALFSLFIAIYQLIEGAYVNQYIVQTFRLSTWFMYFILGGLIPMLEKCFYKVVSFFLHTILLLLTFLAAILFQMHFIKAADAHYDNPIVFFMCLFLVLFVLRIKLSEKAKRIISKLSQLTLGVYIVHPVLIRFLREIIICDSFILSVVLFLVTILISAAITIVINMLPVRKWLLAF